MRNASFKDRELVTAILSDAFDGNKSVNYIVKQGPGKDKRIRALMNYSFDLCLTYGEVYIGKNSSSCALILYPEKKKMTLRAIWLDVRLIFMAIGLFNLLQALNREARIKAAYDKNESSKAYLWFIGVRRIAQGKGEGSALLKHILHDFSQDGKGLYLETSNTRNIAWYKGLGFIVYNQIEIGYSLYFLRNYDIC